ncbi:hypothetical protein C0W80_16080 [Photobacterium leiognathi subsp. mandapamensis]|nr:hypothetical protein C0W80_16080 [Photobacterium leiognathi subsp. mandapamensis]
MLEKANKRLSLSSASFFKWTLVLCSGLLAFMTLYALIPFALIGAVVLVGSKLKVRWKEHR